jgi:hypothetical protein
VAVAIIKHPNYVSFNNDIALVRLPEAVSYTANVIPLCLPVDQSLKNFDYNGQNLTATGYGDFNLN